MVWPRVGAPNGFRRPVGGLFPLSGVLHEYLVNVPPFCRRHVLCGRQAGHLPCGSIDRAGLGWDRADVPFGNTWQLVINTGTTIITFLMVFLIQNTQNRDGAAVQIKLDELIRSSRAHNALLNLEELDDKTLARIREHYCRLADKGRSELNNVEQALAADSD